MSKEWFEEWFDTDYYQLLYHQRNQEEASAFARFIAKQLGLKPGSRILDVGCGRGRHAVAFHDLGFQVTAIDLSDHKISLSQHLQTHSLEFLQHDMRRAFRINYFDLVVSLFTSFGYFHTPHDERSAARSMAANVSWNGFLLVDFLNPVKLVDHLIQKEIVLRNDIQFHVTRSLKDQHIQKLIKVIDKDFTQTFVEKVKLYHFEELVDLFKPFHMSLVASFGNYHLESYQPIHSERMILLFKKIIP